MNYKFASIRFAIVYYNKHIFYFRYIYANIFIFYNLELYYFFNVNF